ncbi:hypothetical protein [Nodosilinea nodulosa]|uniref:hypothetical protein n=1 Tax=Nodosilinea nodulosa TaxID=416001 RepID=UPI00030C5C99|nr:hypothetical protein [Nodosilinea nodulosa]
MVQRSSYPVSSYYRPPVPPQGQLRASQSVPPQAYPGPRPYATPAARRPRAAGYADPRPQPRQVLVAGGSMLALAALLITPTLNRDQAQKVADPFTCIRQEQPQALVSRDQLKQLLDTNLQAPKAAIQEFLKAPYCVLSPGTTEAGLPAEREAYPLEFDPQTWLVVLYDGDRYVGYDFRFR